MPGGKLIAGLKGKLIDGVYTGPIIDRRLETGKTGVTSGILKPEWK